MAYLLDQAIELAGPKTLSGKALLKSKQALHRGDDKTAGKYLYQAFDNLPKKHTDTPLTPKEKQLIEDQLAKLFQKNVTINCKVVDKLANKSYVHLQTGGSIVSYRYLLEALDLARLPIPKSLQKMAQVGSPKLLSSKLCSSNLQSRCGQVGGSVPLIVGGVSAGLVIIGIIILWIRRRNRPTSDFEGSSGVQSNVQPTDYTNLYVPTNSVAARNAKQAQAKSHSGINAGFYSEIPPPPQVDNYVWKNMPAYATTPITRATERANSYAKTPQDQHQNSGKILQDVTNLYVPTNTKTPPSPSFPVTLGYPQVGLYATTPSDPTDKPAW